MKKYTGVVVVAFALFHCIGAMSATLPGSIGDDYLHAFNFERLTIGVNFENIERLVILDGGTETTLKATSYSLFSGYDVLPWLVIFSTAGYSEGDSDVLTVDDDDERLFKWSLGVNANLGKWHFRVPKAMVGDRLTVKAFAEYADYKTDESSGEIEWNDLVLALPFAYERFERNTRLDDEELFRLSVYAGPMLSSIDGTIDLGAGDTDFEESEELGVVAGIDIYFTRNITLGGQVHLFDMDTDDVAARVSFRYHF